jgi:hypothetical protein
MFVLLSLLVLVAITVCDVLAHFNVIFQGLSGFLLLGHLLLRHDLASPLAWGRCLHLLVLVILLILQILLQAQVVVASAKWSVFGPTALSCEWLSLVVLLVHQVVEAIRARERLADRALAREDSVSVNHQLVLIGMVSGLLLLEGHRQSIQGLLVVDGCFQVE